MFDLYTTYLVVRRPRRYYNNSIYTVNCAARGAPSQKTILPILKNHVSRVWNSAFFFEKENKLPLSDISDSRIVWFFLFSCSSIFGV